MDKKIPEKDINGLENYVDIISRTIEEVKNTTDISVKIRNFRLYSLCQLRIQLFQYEKDNLHQRLLTGIAEKKCRMITQITSKTEIKKILHPDAPRYDGNRFYSEKYLPPEEELIFWSNMSLYYPIREHCVKRFIELFSLIFPEYDIKG